MKQHIPKIILGFILIAAGIFGYNKYHYATTHEDTDNAQIETYFVPVLPRMGGYVKNVTVKDYDSVTKGQLLVEIDSDEAALNLAELEADYKQSFTEIENVKASIGNTQAQINALTANLKASQIRKEKSKKDAFRDENLVKDGAITQKQAEDSHTNLDILNAQYDAQNMDILAAKSRLPILQSNWHKAEAMIAVKKVKIDQQKLKLTYSKVFAPTAGKIGKKNIEVGQLIQAGQPLMTIVQDASFWVIANFKEKQIPNLKIGNIVDLKIDAYENRMLKGKIASISESTGAKTSLFPPDNASGNFVKVTQRVPVKIEILDLEKNRDILRAGLSLEASVKFNK